MLPYRGAQVDLDVLALLIALHSDPYKVRLALFELDATGSFQCLLNLVAL